jgi:hypothetical protein
MEKYEILLLLVFVVILLGMTGYYYRKERASERMRRKYQLYTGTKGESTYNTLLRSGVLFDMLNGTYREENDSDFQDFDLKQITITCYDEDGACIRMYFEEDVCINILQETKDFVRNIHGKYKHIAQGKIMDEDIIKRKISETEEEGAFEHGAQL